MEAQRKFISKIDSVVKLNKDRMFDSAQSIYEDADYILKMLKPLTYRSQVNGDKINYTSCINDLKDIMKESDEILYWIQGGFDGFDIDDNFPINDSKALRGLEKEKQRVATIQKYINGSAISEVAKFYKSDGINKAINSIKDEAKRLNTYFTQSINVVKRNAASKRK